MSEPVKPNMLAKRAEIRETSGRWMVHRRMQRREWFPLAAVEARLRGGWEIETTEGNER